MAEYVTIKDLAKEFGLDRSGVRKYVLKQGFSPVSVRSSDTKNQLALAVTGEEAQSLRELRERQGFAKAIRPVENGDGQFYIIQLVPDLDPNRIKLGFATDVSARLDAHRTSAPTAKLVKAWRCRRSWEIAAIASITREGCKLIMNEVFACDDLGKTVKRGDQFFGVMPNKDTA